MYPLGACTREGKELTSPFWGAFASGLAPSAAAATAHGLGRRRIGARGPAAALPLLYALLLLHAGAGRGGGCGLQASAPRLLLWCYSGWASAIGGGCSCRLLLRASVERGLQAWCCSAGATGFSGSAPSGQAAALVLHCYHATLLHLRSTATRKWLLELELVSY
jgi:hypothetical protein